MDWIKQIRADVPDAPILVTAGGLFHYFEESKVVGLLRMLTGFGEIEIVFDSVSKSGMAMMRKKYMKQVGHGDAQMFFYVDSASELAGKIGSGVLLPPYPPNRIETVHQDQYVSFGPVLDGQDGPSGSRMMPSPKAGRSFESNQKKRTIDKRPPNVGKSLCHSRLKRTSPISRSISFIATLPSR